MATRRDPWDRLDKESGPAYEAFLAYRDLGLTRSVVKVAGQLRKSTTLLYRWSTNHSWILRAETWDREQERIRQLERHEAIREMETRHAAIATNMLGLVSRTLIAMVNEFGDDPTAKPLGKREMVEFAKVASELERKARGEPTRIAVTGANGEPLVPASALTQEERRARLAQIQDEIGRRLREDTAADEGQEHDTPLDDVLSRTSASLSEEVHADGD